MSRTSLHLLLATTLAAASMPLAAQQPTAGELARRLELDPPITAGTLANGMHYFVRQNSFPAKRAELRLVVKAGSALEADDQQGLAHFVEHMAFNGTKRFPKQEIVNYLQSIGMRFGPEVNAYTSFDQTVYMLQLPTEDETFLLKGLDILVDWAHAQAFDPAEIDLERGVILEEWRLRRGANARMQDQQYPVLLKGSRYGERLPIGKPEVIRGFPHDALTRFYREWYRPDLMAVIAVGDFDKARVEQLIKERFSIIPAATAATPVPEFPVPPHAEMYVTVATDPEATSSSMVLYSLVPPRDHLTYGGYRERTIERVYFSMLNARLAEIAQKPDAPFVGAGLSRGYFVRTADAFGLSAQFKEGDAERALDAMFTEVERAARHGFTAGELERARATSLAANSQMYARREQRTSQSRADELVRHVANGEDAVGTEGEYEIQRQVLPAVTLEQINELARTLPPAANRVLVVSAPEKTGVTRPDGEKLLAVVSDVGKKNIEAYHDVAVDVPLLATVPPPAAIAAEQTVPAVGLTEWRLANGVRVVLKPTDFQDDEIMMMGMSPGGSSLVPDSLYTQAQLATSVVGMGGLGQLSMIDLRKVLAGKNAMASPMIGMRMEGINGNATKKDLETMFQLAYLRFTSPRRDPVTFAAFRQANQAMLANRAASPQTAFTDTITVTMAQGHPRARPITAETFAVVDLDRAFAVYQDRFADASDFTFVIVGDFELDSIRPHVQRYLGGLPARNRKEAGRDVGIRPPTGVVKKVVRAGAEPVSQTYISFTGSYQYSPAEQYRLASLGEVLRNRLHDKLREALSGTYGVSVSASGSRDEPATYNAIIRFGSAPERAEELSNAVLAEIRLLQEEGPPAADVTKVQEAQRRTSELNLKQNAFWLSNLSTAYQYGDDPADILKHQQLFETLTPEMVRDAARRYLRLDNYVHITLQPQPPRT